MLKLIRRALGRLMVTALWRDYLAGDGRLFVITGDGQEYEWLPDYGDWEPITIER